MIAVNIALATICSFPPPESAQDFVVDWSLAESSFSFRIRSHRDRIGRFSATAMLGHDFPARKKPTSF